MHQLDKMPVNGIFNPQGDDSIESREMWLGHTTNLMQLNDVRYKWAVSLYKQMRENFWIPEKLDITQDVTDYRNLTNAERRAFNGILSYLTFLDSIQTCNIPHLKACVTAPEVSLCMAEQISQEGLHNQSYQYMIETIVPAEERQSVYEFWRTDSDLFYRCEYIAGLYEDYVTKQTKGDYFTAIIADYILEALYFYNGFIFFYNLASRMLMPGSADIFKMINRDELSHVRLYQNIIRVALEDEHIQPDQVYELFDRAVRYEISWTNHITDNQILGITETSTDQYTKYLANIRLAAIGLEKLYKDPIYKTSPYQHLERLSDTKNEAHTKANFFESGVTSYVQSSGLDGWDNI